MHLRFHRRTRRAARGFYIGRFEWFGRDYFGAGLAPCAPPDDSKVAGAVVRTTVMVQRCRRDLGWNDSNGPTLSFAGRHRAGRSRPLPGALAPPTGGGHPRKRGHPKHSGQSVRCDLAPVAAPRPRNALAGQRYARRPRCFGAAGELEQHRGRAWAPGTAIIAANGTPAASWRLLWASDQAQQRPGQNWPPARSVPEVACASASVMCPSGSTYPARQSSRRETPRWNARSWWPSTAAPAWTT